MKLCAFHSSNSAFHLVSQCTCIQYNYNIISLTQHIYQFSFDVIPHLFVSLYIECVRIIFHHGVQLVCSIFTACYQRNNIYKFNVTRVFVYRSTGVLSYLTLLLYNTFNNCPVKIQCEVFYVFFYFSQRYYQNT